MIILKITDVRKADGNYDYKGLDVDAIVPGTQLYPFDKNEAYFKYPTHEVVGPDIEVITEPKYLAEKERIETMNSSLSEIELLQEENRQLKESVADLWEVVLLGGI